MQKTVVIFRVMEGEVIALFPEIPATMERQHCLSYQHVGQHGAADPQFVIRNSTPASPKQYEEVMDELEGHYGYDLDVKNRYTNSMRTNRQKGKG